MTSEEAARISSQTTSQILNSVTAIGGDGQDAMLALEMIVTATLLTIVRPGADESVLDTFRDNISRLLAEARLRETPVAGSA